MARPISKPDKKKANLDRVMKWRNAHRDRYNAYMLRYYHAHKEKFAEYKRKKRLESWGEKND